MWALLPMVGAALVALAAFVALRRWSSGPQWTSRHLLAASFGALVGHTAFGLVGHADTVADRVFLVAVGIVTAAVGVVVSRRAGDGQMAPAALPEPVGHTS